MAKYQSTIEYNIKTNLDASGLQKLQAQLMSVETTLQRMGSKQNKGMGISNDIQSSIAAVQELQTLLNQSFNSKLGILDLSKLNSGLRTSSDLAGRLGTAFQTAGAQGQIAANNLVTRLYKMDTGLKSVSKTTDKIVNTIGNTFRWGVIASAFASVMNAVHGAAQYTSELDKSLTNIMMVSGESRDNMNEFAKAANEAAQRMGSTTTAMTNATQIFVQQGLSLDESEKLAEYSVHLANVSGQDSTKAADEITAYKNAFKINLEDIENAISKWAAVANSAAVSVEELSVASQKAASVAKTVGVDMDQFAGHITAIEATTREAPENIGNGLKTLYSRISDIKLGESLEDGVDLGQFTTALHKVGVEALDASGQLRDAGAIIEDLMARWGELSTTEQVATATTVAGRFQLARFEALMNSADIYNNVVGVSRAETGTETYDRMQETFRDSMQGRMNALTASIEEIFNNLFTTDSLYPFIDGVQLLVDTFNDLIESVGGGQNALSAFGLIFGQVFNTQIARGINNLVQNRELAQAQQMQMQHIQELSRATLAGGGYAHAFENTTKYDKTMAGVGQYATIMSEEQIKAVGENSQNLANAFNKVAAAEQELSDLGAQLEKEFSSLGISSKNLAESLAMAETGTKKNLSTFRTLRVGGLDALGGIANLASGASNILQMGNYRNQKDSAISLLQAHVQNYKTDANFGNVLSKNDFTALEGAIRKVDQVVLKGTDGVKQYKQAYNELLQLFEKLEGKIAAQTTAVTEASMAQQKYVQDLRVGTVEAQHATESIEGMTASLANQSTIQNITNLAMGVGQIAFAMNSIRSLGNIISSEDISNTEKMTEVLMNIGFTIPMVIMGYNQLKSAFSGTWIGSAISTHKQAVIALEEQKAATVAAAAEESILQAKMQAGLVAKEKYIAATEQTALALEKQVAAQKVADAAAKTALLSKVLIGATVGISVAIMAMQAFIDKQNEMYQSSKKATNEVISNYQEITDSVEQFDNLYDKYKETGEVTDELRQATETLTESFGIQDAQVQTAIGNYDSLAKSIHEAAEEKRKASEADIQAFLNGSNADSLRGGGTMFGNHSVPWNGSVFDELGAGLITTEIGHSDLMPSYVGPVRTATADEWDAFRQNDDVAGAIGYAKQKLREYQDAANALEEEINQVEEGSHTKYKLEQQRDKYLEMIDTLNQAFDIEDIADFIEKSNQWAQMRAQDILDELDENASLNDITQAFFNNSDEMTNFLESLGGWSEQLSWMISQTSNETLKNTLLLRQATEQFGQSAYGKVNDAVSAVGLDTAGMGFANQGAYVDQVVSGMINQIADSGLTDNERLEFMAGIDWNKSLQEIQEQIDSLKASDELPKLEFEPALTDRSDFSETQVDDLLKDANLTQSGFNAMSADIFDTEGIQAAAKKVTSSIDDVRKKIDEGSISSEDGAKEIAKLRQQYENLGKTSKDIAAYNLQMNKGVSNLVKNWKNYAEVIEQDAAKGTSDYYQVLGELDETISDILNIDTGVLSRGFYENADALDAMARAADGDVTAIDELRMLAAEDIILHLDVQGITAEDKDYLINQELIPMLNEIQSLLDGAPLGTTIDVDTNPFIQKLNQLLADSQITAEQASNILSSIGMDATISTVSQSVPQHHTMQFPRFRVETDEKTGMMTGIVPEGVETVSWDSEDDVSFPVIEGATYTGSGVQTVGASSAGNTGGSGGSKGGGGSGGKEPSQVSRTNPADTEKDIYNKVNAEMERLQDNYKRITRLRDNSYGSNFRKYSAQEIANLEAQNANLEKRQKITKKYIEALKSNKDNDKLNIKKTDTLGYYGLTDTDNDGVVDNYDSIVDKARADAKKAQKAADDYFKAHGGAFDSDGNTTTEATMTEEESKHYKKLTETASNAADRVSGITDAVNKYQDAWDDARDTEEQIQENLEAIKQVQIEIFEQALKGIDNLKELNKQAAKMKGFFEAWDGTGKRTLSNSPFRALTSDVAELDGMLDSVDGKASTFFDRMQKQSKDDDQKKFWQSLEKQAKENGVNGSSIVDLETFALQALLDPNQAKQYFDLDEQEYHDVLTQLKTTIEDDLIETEQTMEDLLDNIIAAYDDINERMEDRLDLYEREQDKLSHILNMTKIIYGDDYDKINEVLQKQIDAINIRASDVNKYIAYWQEQLDNVNEALKLNPNDPALQEQAKHLDATLENYKKQARDLIEEAAELADEKFSNALENAAKKFQDAMLSGNGRSYAWEVERWELAKEAADEYKDSVEKGYEIDKLRAKYQKLLDGSSTLKVQKQIKNSMQEQLAYLENQTNLSQFDVDLANAKLELLQKQIALEEAQRNKNQMRLRRDTQGNYGYVYAANNDDIADKQQEVLDSGYDIYEMSKSEQQRLTDESLRLLQDYTERYKQIAADKTLSDEERAARLEELAAQFKKRMEALNADFDDAIDGMIDGAKILAEYAADDVAEYFDAIANTTKDNWEETMDTVGVAYSDTIRNMATDTTTFEGQVDNFANDINTALDEFDENVTSTAESFGENFDDISDDVQDVIDQMQDLNSETAKFLDLIADDTKKISKAQQKLGDYQATLEGLTETSSALREALDEANKKLKKAEEDTLYWKAKYNEAVKPKSSGSSGSGGGSNSGGNNAAASKPELKPGAYATLKSGHVYHYSSYGDSPTGNYNAGIKDGVVIQGYSGKQIGGSQTAGPYYIALHGSGKNGANTWQLGWVKPEDLEGYDTGGYTGAWGTEGRAALLHEKELVLNKDDTENMLAAIKLVRDMVSIIQTPTLSSAIGGITQALNDTIEQRVEVTAEFPNATDADDIRSAILSLADDAFQYAYSTR